jgi:hypothetical protein
LVTCPCSSSPHLMLSLLKLCSNRYASILGLPSHTILAACPRGILSTAILSQDGFSRSWKIKHSQSAQSQ